jgi:hypothetical protein
MGINFGGIIAGIDKEWTRQIESRERKEEKTIDRAAGVDDAMKLADYRQKLGVEDSNRTERKELEKWGTETAGTLKALGVNDTYVKSIIALGKGGGNQYQEMIKAAYAKDPSRNINTLLKGLGVENYNDVVATVQTQDNNNVSTNTSLEDSDSNVETNIYQASFGTVDEIYTDDSAYYTAMSQQLAQAVRNGNKKDIEKYTQKKADALTIIKELETTKNGGAKKFTPSDIRAEVALQRTIAFSNIGKATDSITGEIIDKLEGEEGQYAIAAGEAVQGMIAINSSFEKEDPQLTVQINNQKDLVRNSLNDWAIKTSSSEFAGTFGLGSAKKELTTFQGALDNISSYKRADVVPIGNDLYVYVGTGSWLATDLGINEKTGKKRVFPFYKVGS